MYRVIHRRPFATIRLACGMIECRSQDPRMCLGRPVWTGSLQISGSRSIRPEQPQAQLPWRAVAGRAQEAPPHRRVAGLDDAAGSPPPPSAPACRPPGHCPARLASGLPATLPFHANNTCTRILLVWPFRGLPGFGPLFRCVGFCGKGLNIYMVRARNDTCLDKCRIPEWLHVLKMRGSRISGFLRNSAFP